MKNTILKLSAAVFLFGFITSCDRDDDGEPTPSSCQEITEDIIQTRTLIDLNADPNVADYCINSKISIAQGAGLIIEPGVVIEFGQNAGINIGTGLTGGYIIAEGTSTKPIRFTGNVKTPGFWRGLYVYYTSNDVRNSLDYCIIEYAGSEELQSPAGGLGYKAAVGVGTSSAGPVGLISIKNSTLQYNSAKGYACRRVGLNEFENNAFIDNSEEAVYLDIDGFSKMDENSTFTGNGFDGVRQAVIAGIKDKINDGQVHTWKALSNSSYYWLSNGGGVDNGTLIIEPGVIIQMESGKQFEIDTEGSMSAVGTASNPIIFRGTVPGTPSWNAIFFRSQSVNNVMEHCIIKEAGLGTILSNGCNGEASIGLFYWAGTGSRLNISNCTIEDGNGCGIFTSINNIGNLTESDITYTNVSGSNICN